MRQPDLTVCSEYTWAVSTAHSKRLGEQYGSAKSCSQSRAMTCYSCLPWEEKSAQLVTRVTVEQSLLQAEI